MIRKPADTYTSPDGLNTRALAVWLWGRRTMPALGLVACFVSSTVYAENIHSSQHIVQATGISNVRSMGEHLPEQLLNGKDVITMTSQTRFLLGVTRKAVGGATIELPREEVTEYHGYVAVNGQEITFLHDGENITYVGKAKYKKDKTSGLEKIDLVPRTLETGVHGTYTATRLSNNDVKIDVRVSDVELVEMPDCSDTQCPVTVGRESRNTVILSPDHAETVDLPAGDNNGQSIRLIFSRKQLPQQVKPGPSGTSVHRT